MITCFIVCISLLTSIFYGSLVIYEKKLFGLLDSRLCFVYNECPFKVIFAHAKIRRDRLPLAVFF